MVRIVKQPDIRRQELLDIGLDLYFKEGEKGVSIQHVVQQANVATGLFYYYFKTKDAFLDEALNGYIDKEMNFFEEILCKPIPALEKVDEVLDAFFAYAEKMAPFRFSTSFHTKKHYALTNIIIERLKKEVSSVLQQGVDEQVLLINHVDLIACFIVNGLSSIFDANIEVDKASLTELKGMIRNILMGDNI